MGVKIRQGDDLDAISAGEFNRHVDVAEWYFRNIANGNQRPTIPDARNPDLIIIKNSSTADRRKGEILKVGDYLNTGLSDDDDRYPWFDTAIHDGTDAPLCVLLNPIKNGDFGWAQIGGVCHALVNFGHADQRYARPANNDDVLQGGGLGPVRVLYKPSGTGEKVCRVNLTHGQFTAVGVTDAAHNKAASGTISIYTGTAGSETDTGYNETAWNRYANVGSAKKVHLALTNGRIYLIAAEC